MKQIEMDILRDNPEILFLKRLRDVAKDNPMLFQHTTNLLADKIKTSAAHVTQAQAEARRDMAHERAQAQVAYFRMGGSRR